MIPLFKVLINPTAANKVAEVLTSGYTGEGAVCKEFESEFQKLIGSKIKPLLTNSCTHALDLAYHLTLERGDTVIVSPMTCLATTMPLLHRGIKIIWADVDKYTGNIDLISVGNLIDDDDCANVKVIIGIDWAGRQCDYDILKVYGVPVIQDAAHNVLADTENGGDYIAYSFQSIKTLSMGDGGALIVPEDDYDEAKKFRWFYLDRDKGESMRCKNDTEKAGFKYQSNDILASIGLENMKLTKWAVEKHRDNALVLYNELKDIDGINIPEYGASSCYWMFGLTVDKMDRDKLIEKLGENGVAASEAHRRNDLQTCFKEFRRNDLPGLDYFSAHQLNIPTGWWLKENDLAKIVDTMKKILA